MIQIKNLTKKFPTASGETTVLTDINIDIQDGDIFGIIGLSGAGKSTLVRCVNLLEKPTQGEVWIDNVNLTEISKKELYKIRKNIGMIFQNYNLLEQRTILKNVMFPLELIKMPRVEAEQKAMEMLEIVGLSEKAKLYPAQLSGGQKQRVAIARALATEPKYLLCDEATSALDPTTTESILELIKKINQELGVTIVVITHEMSVIESICNRVAVIDESRIVEIGDVVEVFSNPKSPIARELILPCSRSVSSIEGEKKIRIIFDGELSNHPLISNMVLDCGVPVNILFAETKDVGGKAYGQLLLGLPNDEQSVKRVSVWLNSHHPNYKRED